MNFGIKKKFMFSLTTTSSINRDKHSYIGYAMKIKAGIQQG